MKVSDEAFIRLHRGYEILITKVLGRKLSQQYTGPFQIAERVSRLAYGLDIPIYWRIEKIKIEKIKSVIRTIVHIKARCCV